MSTEQIITTMTFVVSGLSCLLTARTYKDIYAQRVEFSGGVVTWRARMVLVFSRAVMTLGFLVLAASAVLLVVSPQ
ncbi:Uncharacterised protein [Mycobacteroides abscessus subsp. abscessus]|uniref:hypothetical protein n=1 Tax=Mycobacteroides abscessus TaxID=36809 RepID=UPI00092B1E53|nr:hypothetical protein [Mycobacteroides abscessus]SHY46667.1 Uncharacterised protein [Mycobacteroides abscessus subsp. abscessus]